MQSSTLPIPIHLPPEIPFARALLRYLTRYSAPDTSPSHSRRGLRALGGPQQAQQRLEAIVEAWRSRAPLDAEILEQFLAGWERREIVRSFVSRHLYEDSRIYRCIKRLPKHIAQALRMAQARDEDA